MGRARRPVRTVVVFTLILDAIGLILLGWNWAGRLELLTNPDWLPDPGFALLIPIVFLQFPIALSQYIDRSDLAWWGRAIRVSFGVVAILMVASVVGFIALAAGGQGPAMAGAAGVLLVAGIGAIVIAILYLAYVVLLFRLAPAVQAYATELADTNARASSQAESWPGTRVLAAAIACSVVVMLALGIFALRGRPGPPGPASEVAGLYVHPDKPDQRILLAENGEFSYVDQPGVLEKIVTRASRKGFQFGVNTGALEKLVSGSYKVEGNDIVVRYNDANARFHVPKLTLNGDQLSVPGYGTFVKRPDLHAELEKARDQFMAGPAGGAVKKDVAGSKGGTVVSKSGQETKRYDPALPIELGGPPMHDPAGICVIELAPDKSTVASGSVNGWVRLWDTASGKQIFAAKTGDERIGRLMFSAAGKTLVAWSESKPGANDDVSVHYWEIPSGTTPGTRPPEADLKRGMAMSSDGSLAASSDGPNIQLLDWKTKKTLLSWQGHGGTTRALAFSPNGKFLASAADYEVGKAESNDIVKLWEVPSGRLLQKWKGLPEKGQNSRLVFSSDGRSLATVCGAWSVPDGAPTKGSLRVVTRNWGGCLELGYNIGDLFLARGFHWGYNFDVFVVPAPDAAHGHIIVAYSVSGDDALIATVAGNGKSGAGTRIDLTKFGGDVGHSRLPADSFHKGVIGQDITPGRVGHSRPVTALAFSPDGNELASMSWNDFCLWNLKTNAPSERLTRAALGKDFDEVIKKTFWPGRWPPAIRSPDGKIFVEVNSFLGFIYLNDQTGKTIKTFAGDDAQPGIPGGIAGCGFSPDSKLLATTDSRSGDVCLWSFPDLVLQRRFKGHGSGSLGVAFSPDGKTLATGNADGTILLWNLSAGDAGEPAR
jgi:WD40 repeat protein